MSDMDIAIPAERTNYKGAISIIERAERIEQRLRGLVRYANGKDLDEFSLSNSFSSIHFPIPEEIDMQKLVQKIYRDDSAKLARMKRAINNFIADCSDG